MNKKFSLLAFLLVLILLTACNEKKYLVKNMELVQFEPRDKKIYGVGHFKDAKNEVYKFLLYNDSFRMMRIGQKYDITYIINAFRTPDYSITNYKPSNHINDET